jgi:hypothetical protein
VERGPRADRLGARDERIPVQRRAPGPDELGDVADEAKPERRPRAVDRQVEEGVDVRQDEAARAGDGGRLGALPEAIDVGSELALVSQVPVELQALEPLGERAEVLQVVESVIHLLETRNGPRAISGPLRPPRAAPRALGRRPVGRG